MASSALRDFSWERMIAAVEAVRERARRVASTLAEAGLPYMIVGGNAVASWVARVDAEAVRNTADVDLLVRRSDLGKVVDALQAVGFVFRNVNGVDLFLDGPEGSVRSAVHVLYAGERVRAGYSLPAPDVTECEQGPEFLVPTLEALVRLKLTSFRLKDQVHIQDLLEVGLIDSTWCDRLPDDLAARLRQVIETRRDEQ